MLCVLVRQLVLDLWPGEEGRHLGVGVADTVEATLFGVMYKSLTVLYHLRSAGRLSSSCGVDALRRDCRYITERRAEGGQRFAWHFPFGVTASTASRFGAMKVAGLKLTLKTEV